MFPTFGSSNPWRSRSQPPPVQRRAGRGPQQQQPPASSSSATTPQEQQAQPSRKAAQEEPEEEKKEEEPVVDERTQRLQELDRLATRFQDLERKFSPPPAAKLVFQPRASLNAPKLEYNSTNAPIHGYEEGLTRLLTELDGVESGGDVKVRTTRKALATKVEGEAQRVEKWRRDVFEAKQAGGQGPEWVPAEPSSTGSGAAPAQDGSAETSGTATPEPRQSQPAQPHHEDAETEAEGEEPETPVDEVVYHARDSGESRRFISYSDLTGFADSCLYAGHQNTQQTREQARRQEPGPHRANNPAKQKQQQQQSQRTAAAPPIPMCRAEDGDEEEMLTSADEREMSRREQQQQQPPSRGRHSSAPSQARPPVPTNNTNAPKSSPHPSSSARPTPSQQHPHPHHAQPPPPRRAPAAPLDPFEALFGGGGGGLGPFAPSGRREVPGSYATYPDRRAGAGEGESEGLVYDDEGIPYLVDPRTGTWYPQAQSPSRVPWYGHGYPREQDLGGYQDARRRSSAAYAPSSPPPRTSQRGRGGGGWMTPDNDYLFGRGGPLGGWGW